jgi:hypothetical protein
VDGGNLARPVGAWIDQVLSQMAPSQVRLFLVAPTDRQTHLRPPGRKSLFDFDHARLNCAKQYAIAKVSGLRNGALLTFHLFSKN